MDLTGKRVAIVGLGASGLASARACVARGARLVLTDVRPREAFEGALDAFAREGAEICVGGHESARLSDADAVVISPGVPMFPLLRAAEQRGVPIWSEIELGHQILRKGDPSAKLVAIGGTNGKSTVTTLVGDLLGAASKRVFVGGNLGDPFVEHAEKGWDYVVVEVSSFQMERVDTFHPQAAALLNVTPDHLDRYRDLQAYADAKGNAFVRQTPSDFAVVPAGDAVCLAQARRGRGTVVTFGIGDGDVVVSPDAVEDRRTGNRFLRRDWFISGTHNALNVAAALALVGEWVDADTARHVLRSFRGLPHRTAFVAEIRGVRYYDDSKGTNVGASVTALMGMEESRAVLIAGGRDKGGSYEPLADALRARGRAAVLIGESTPLLEEALAGAVPTRLASSMDEAVRFAAELAQEGDAVLLSPACSSYDMFRDYKHRGDEFVRFVRDLAAPERPERPQ